MRISPLPLDLFSSSGRAASRLGEGCGFESGKVICELCNISIYNLKLYSWIEGLLLLRKNQNKLLLIDHQGKILKFRYVFLYTYRASHKLFFRIKTLLETIYRSRLFQRVEECEDRFPWTVVLCGQSSGDKVKKFPSLYTKLTKDYIKGLVVINYTTLSANCSTIVNQ
jgi:hypothetical protein